MGGIDWESCIAEAREGKHTAGRDARRIGGKGAERCDRRPVSLDALPGCETLNKCFQLVSKP